MAVHTVIEKEGIWFITFTCFRWIPLIEITDGYNMVYKYFRHLSTHGITILAYVIMPNHIHLLLHFNGNKRLNTHIGNSKRFMAYEIVKQLEKKGETALLTSMANAVLYKDRTCNKKHEVWIPGFDAKECRTEKFILQKLHYIHNNPVSGKWKLAESPAKYLHSSAQFYLNGKQQLYPVKDYRDFMNREHMSEQADEFLS